MTAPERASAEAAAQRPAAGLDGGALVFWQILMTGAVVDIVRGRDHPVWPAVAALALFVVLYTATVLSVRPRVPAWARYVLLGALTVEAVAYAAWFGHNATQALMLLAMAAGAVLPLVMPALAGVAVCTVIALLVTVPGGSSGTITSLVSGVATAGTVIVVLRRLFATIGELRATREELAHTAVSRERLRFARDLHDLLGHTLSLIVVKGEIVQRLAVRDPEAAAAQAGDIIGIGRAALGEVRQAVSGYRARGVSAELDDARIALDDAGVDAEITRTGPPPSAEADLLFGWVVREAVTNVIRHSGARRCHIDVGSDTTGARLTVTDDGRGAAGEVTHGNGLTGLAERMAAAGGTLRTGAGRRGGFTVTATLPVQEEA